MSILLSPPSVYLVDDDPLVRAAGEAMVSSFGFSVRTFESAAAFLACAAELPLGCLLLDIRMPEMDGLALMAGFRARIAAFPIIVMTGHGDVDIAVRAMKLGAVDFVQKPFRPSLLKDMLDQAFTGLSHSRAATAEQSTALATVARLTAREVDVLRGLLAGLSNKLVAHRLGVSTRTVDMHRANMMKRLNAKSLPVALKLALAAGVSPLT